MNLPAPGWTLASSINRDWTDDSGKGFRSRLTGLYDADAGIVGINNQQIVNTLANGDPLIIGAGSHAMVLTEVGYLRDPFGGVGALDYGAVFAARV